MGHITNRGWKWELLNSWWIILSFFGFTTPLAFFYIGYKGKKKLWTGIGLAYVIVMSILAFFSESLGNQFGGILVTLIVVGAFLSIMFRKEFLIRFDMIEKSNIGDFTNRGWKWELLNSWWIILSFFWFTAPFGFFYIGYKGKNKLWTGIGLAYIIIVGVLFFFSKQLQAFIDGGILVIILVGGVFLSILFRKEFLIRIDMLGKTNIQETEREIIADKLSQKGLIVSNNDAKAEEPKQAEELPIDINTCTLEDFSSLPGITLIQAKKAISYRQDNKGFSSVEDFYRIIGLKPHFIVQIGNKIVCSKLVEKAETPKNNQIGRKLDL